MQTPVSAFLPCQYTITKINRKTGRSGAEDITLIPQERILLQ